jgi:hypothetical protein
LKVNKVNLFVSSVLFVFWYHSPNFLGTPRMILMLTNSYLQIEMIYLSFRAQHGSYRGDWNV